MNKKLSFSLIVAGLVLAVAGFYVNKGDWKIVTASANEQYSVTWNATKVFRLQFGNRPGNTNPFTGQTFPTVWSDSIVSGIARWDVIGEIAGTRFKEEWRTSDPSNIIVDYNANNNFTCRQVNDINYAEWIMGCGKINAVSDQLPEYLRYVVADKPSNHFGVGNTEGAPFSGTGGACPQMTCIGTLGSYSIATYNRQNNSPIRLFTLIPLKWTVTGEILSN